MYHRYLLFTILLSSCVNNQHELNEQYNLNGLWIITSMVYDQEELVKWFNVNAVDFEENSKVTLPPNPGSQFQNIGEYKLYHTGNIIDSIEIYCVDTTFNGSFKITSADYRKFNGVKDSVLVGCLLEDERRFIVMKRSTGW